MRTSTIGFLLATALFWSGSVHAQSSGAAAAEIRRLHVLAMENYDLADYAGARDLLLNAVQQATDGKLSKDLLNAKTHVMLGAIYLIGGKDGANANKHFKTALTIAPGITIEPPLNTKAVMVAFANADAELNPVITCTTLRGIDHLQVVQAKAGTPVRITFKAGPELRNGSAYLSYRNAGKVTFIEVPVSPQSECEYAGEIPADAVQGELLHYFVAMKKSDGRYIAMRGNPQSPYPITIITPASALPEAGTETKDEVPNELVLGGQPPPRGAGCAGCGAANTQHGDSAGWMALVLLCAIAVRRTNKHKCEAPPSARS